MNKNSPRKNFHESRKETEKISYYLGKSKPLGANYYSI